MAFKKRRKDRNAGAKKKQCRFSQDHELVIDYRKTRLLSEFLTERGKIISRRVTGTSRYHQNQLETAINRARHLALLPYTITHSTR